MEIQLQNIHAEGKLALNVELTCNTTEEQVLKNVLANSQDAKRPWVKREEAHELTALLVGSGPSLKASMPALWKASYEGGKIFALNGAVKFLADENLLADCQIIMDAQPGTLDLVGPAHDHLLASQVDPRLFEAKPDATLWHATYGNLPVDEQPGFPAQSRSYCVLGAATSVGVTALGLLYALGYRRIVCFGFDSSNAGSQSHVLPQALNDNDVYTFTRFRGKTYTSSLTMKQQVSTFLQRAALLRGAGCKISVEGYGLLPDLFNAPQLSEVEKYEAMWALEAYREVAPGEHCAKDFLELCRPRGRVIDFGCGTGRGGLAIAKAGLDVLLVDFVEGSRDEAASHLPFSRRDLSKVMNLLGDYGYCTDVMEHIPPKQVEDVIHNLFACVPTVFFQISLVPDTMGAAIGQALHLSVHPLSWWYDLFHTLGYHVLWNRDQGDSALFLVSAD